MRNKNFIKAGVAGFYIVWLWYKMRRRRQKKSKSRKRSNRQKKRKVAVDMVFARNFLKLFRILFPRLLCRETFVLIAHTTFLVLRTTLSLWLSRLDGILSQSIVEVDFKGFTRGILLWFLTAVPATFINSMIRYCESMLALLFRARLTKHCYNMYMKNDAYYRIGNLDHRIENPDQCMTEDIKNFTSLLAHLHSHISKPLLDVVVFTADLNRRVGKESLGGAAVVVMVTAELLQLLTPPFGQLVERGAELEGTLRSTHSRIISNSEEIAFYRGHNFEKKKLVGDFRGLVAHMSSYLGTKVPYHMLQGFLMKYTWGAFGLIMSAAPVFFYGNTDENTRKSLTASETAKNTGDFIVTRNLLTTGSDAVERLMSSYGEIAELAGYTARVSDMVQVLQDMSVQGGAVPEGKTNPLTQMALGRYEVAEDALIEFKDVSIVTPNDDLLVEHLNFAMGRCQHVIIIGPNGCGKSSLFRILCGLWPLRAGVIRKPPNAKIFYIPQRPYLPRGTFRDQIIYPHTVSEMEGTDEDLEKLLEVVDLKYLLTREAQPGKSAWDTEKDWIDVLSGGEKQRVAMARLFYHRPKFAILDECTSAVSVDVEGKMYMHATAQGISLLTVSHRPTLWKYHKHVLRMDGLGGWSFSELENVQQLEKLQDEKLTLERDIEALLQEKRARLGEIDRELGALTENDDGEADVDGGKVGDTEKR